MMGSRIRENVTHVYECFCEIVKPGETDAWIIQKFPEYYKDEEVLRSVPKFAYPCEFDNSVVQHYSFVLTSVDSKWTFGFCRHDPKSETALVLLSFLPWHESFYKLLNHVSDILHGSQPDSLWPFLQAVYSSRPPDPGSNIRIPHSSSSNSVFECTAPKPFILPSIPENRNLTEYFNAVDNENMMIVFASLLLERRIVVRSRKLSRLSCCVQAANALIYPMTWQHIFIPVLPTPLADYLLAPMPYLIGVPFSLTHKVHKADVGDVVVLDADANTVTTPFDDLSSLPSNVVKELRNELKNKSNLLGDGVSRSFLRALVSLIGGYRDALKFHQGERITFDENAFVESRPTNIQPFLRKMLHLQIFQQFIDERLAVLNAGLGFSDEFELETCNYSDKTTSSRLKAQYKEWTHTMKREGTAFFKTVKTKANPAVKSAVKTVKERGRDVGKAYKGIRSRFKDHLGDDKPIPRPNLTTNLPSNNSVINYQYRVGGSRNVSNTGSGSKTASRDTSPDSAPLHMPPIDMDLMGDLHNVLFSNSPVLDLPTSSNQELKPVRSLENSYAESHSSFSGKTEPGSTDSIFLQQSQHLNKKTIVETGDLIILDDGEGEVRESRGAAAAPRDVDLLLEYGLDFSQLSLRPPLTDPTQNWTKFD